MLRALKPYFLKRKVVDVWVSLKSTLSLSITNTFLHSYTPCKHQNVTLGPNGLKLAWHVFSKNCSFILSKYFELNLKDTLTLQAPTVKYGQIHSNNCLKVFDHFVGLALKGSIDIRDKTIIITMVFHRDSVGMCPYQLRGEL